MKRNVRRILVVAYYLVLFALYPLVQGLFWETALFFVLLFASPATAAGTEMLKALNHPDAKADERQRAIINETMKKSYLVLAVALLIPAFLLGFTDDVPARMGEAADDYISNYLFSFRILFLLISTVPPAVMMWLEPNPLPEDELSLSHRGKYENGWLKSPMRRSSRRVWVVVIYVLIASAVALGVTRAAEFVITYSLGSLAMLAAARLNYATARTISLPDEALDERQRGLKNRVYRISYHASYTVVIFVAIVLYQLKIDSLTVIGMLAYAYFVVATVLPTTILAWLEPDPPEDETLPVKSRAA